MRAWCNGSMQVSKTFDLGSNPSARANFLRNFKMNKFFNYLQESYQELTKKVSWPSWIQLTQSTVIVIGASLFITFLVWVMDSVVGLGLSQFYK
jgi:preprotein translocase subunit SecE